MYGPTSESESLLNARPEKELEMFNEDYAKVNNDYRREQLSRSWTRVKGGSRRQFLPRLPSARRPRRAA